MPCVERQAQARLAFRHLRQSLLPLLFMLADIRRGLDEGPVDRVEFQHPRGGIVGHPLSTPEGASRRDEPVDRLGDGSREKGCQENPAEDDADQDREPEQRAPDR